MSQRLYAVEHCSCIYESGFDMHSLHATTRGAAKAMNELKSVLHQRYVEGVDDHEDEIFIVSTRRAPQFFDQEAFRYRAIEVSA